MNLLFIQGKGGVGKSTLAFLFAIALDRVGKTISIQDLDPQESLTAWLKDTSGFKFADDGEITVIDCPPQIDHPAVVEAIAKADRIIIPTSPSPAELATTRHTCNVIAEHMPKSARALVVFNRVKKSSTYGKNLGAMAANLPLPAAQSFLSDREVYKHALLDGWSALDAAAKDEVTSLALEIQ